MYESIEKELAVSAKKARENGCWFYCQQTKHWMTPEEFEMQGKANRIAHGQNDRTILTNYHMSDPREGIRARMALAKKVTTELQDFSEKVFAYFNHIPKDKK